MRAKVMTMLYLTVLVIVAHVFLRPMGTSAALQWIPQLELLSIIILASSYLIS